MPLTPPLLREAAAYLTPESAKDLTDAYQLAKSIYGEEIHSTGEPLLIHVEKIARLLLRLHPDVRTLIACLLQFARSTPDLTGIERRFGKRTVRTISTLSVLEKGCEKTTMYSPGYLRKMVEALAGDIRVLLIFLHNRWHLLEQARHLEPKRQRAIAREALEVFAPMSARLGVYSLKYALETLAFSILYPEESAHIEQGLRELRKQQGPFVTESARALKRLLMQEGKRVEVLGREKHPYSIFHKMRRKNLSKMTDLHDLFGLRVLVDTEEDCYQVLGLVHRTYRPVMHRMKDYIAFPKPNGYHSLHTTILGLGIRDSTLPFEIQIRTQEMDEEAELGIAAHWDYKEGGTDEPAHQKLWRERTHALRELLQKSRHGEGASTALSEMLSDRIYVLTPKGDPVELPKGATPLDFAFHVHTDIGLCFRSARVNGAIVPIDQTLENGDMIDIMKWSEPHPSEQWMQIVRTQEARSKLRAFFRRRGEKIPPESRIAEQRVLRAARLTRSFTPPPPTPVSLVTLDAETALPHRFAQCCAPFRKEMAGARFPPIIGFITRTGTINIHKRSCHMLTGANPKRCIAADWKRPSTPGMSELPGKR